MEADLLSTINRQISLTSKDHFGISVELAGSLSYYCPALLFSVLEGVSMSSLIRLVFILDQLLSDTVIALFQNYFSFLVLCWLAIL